MSKLFRFVLISIFLVSILNASSYSSNLRQYNNAKKNYVKIIGYNNKQKEIKYLKQLIYYGTKLKKNINKYKRELKRLDKKYKLSWVAKKPKYSIKNIYKKNNQIIITFNKKISKKDIRYFTRKGKGKYQYIFDLKGRFKKAKATKISINGINRTKIIQYRFNTLRIALTNKFRIKPIYIIQKKKIIIKIIKKRKRQTKKIKQTKAKKVQYATIKRKTIVIDPGHGGKDSGAVGSRRRYEKTVVLNIGKYLYQNLRQRGYRVFITRNKDKFVSLRYRTKLANSKNADIFISIHANSTIRSKAKQARGIETYFLSPARSARAKRVAEKENKGDVDAMGWSSKNTFLTILNQGKITASNKMAIDIHKNMLYSLRKKYGKWAIRDGGVREGPFWVLVGAQMPSILIEVGYISHPSESKRIYSKKYQKLIAYSIANGLDSYFLKNQ